jgi:hypothetical protein
MPSNISKKLDISLRYLQLQIGTPYNPSNLDYKQWGFLAPLWWVKMLWSSLQHFNITIQMNFPSIPHQRECDKIIMDLIQKYNLTQAVVKSLSRCRGKLETIFLSDIMTADGQYIEPSAMCFTQGTTRRSRFKFPREEPTKSDWETWEQFWQAHTGQGYKLATPLGNWMQPSHQRWLWFYDTQQQLVIKHIDGSSKLYYHASQRTRGFRSATTFTLTQHQFEPPLLPQEVPTSVSILSNFIVKKLQDGPHLATSTETELDLVRHLQRPANLHRHIMAKIWHAKRIPSLGYRQLIQQEASKGP